MEPNFDGDASWINSQFGEQNLSYCSLSQHSPFCVRSLCRWSARPHIGVDSGMAAQAQGKEQKNAQPDQGPASRHVDGQGCAAE
jgi:hypothetical protein